MIYEVSHHTRYRYGEPTSISHHVLHLAPRPCEHQRCHRSVLEVTPAPASSVDDIDYFGNPVTYLTVQESHTVRGRLDLDGASFTSVFQGAIRNNTYVGLAGVGALYGEAGLAVMGIVVFVVVTLVNVLSVIVLVSYRGRAMRVRDLLVSLAKNPLILACVGGFVLNTMAIGLFDLASAMLEILGRAALTLGLLWVGAGLDLGRLGCNPPAVVAASTLKLVVMPVATWGFCHLLGVEGVSAATALLFTAAPISASSYVLARQLGGDAPLMAGLITLSTILAATTMPLALALLT